MRSPFKFLDAYGLEDKDYFFGREQEIADLYRMVFKTPLLLVYGLSGTGKTSLVQCGLASRFDGPDWYPLFIRRQENINRALHNAVRQALPEPAELPLPSAIRTLYRYYLRPVYLVFDQLEELFILGDWEEQEQFVQSLKELLDSDLPCTLLFVMREEYIGRLYHFEKIIPALFDHRLRVEPMNVPRVKTVLESSFATFRVTLDPPGDASYEKIIDNISAGKSGIQLPYLQVYLDLMYREAYRKKYGEEERGERLPPLVLTEREINAFGSIEDILEQFLRRQEAEWEAQLQQRYSKLPTGTVRGVLDVFVTEEGTKRPVRCQRNASTKLIEVEAKVKPLLPAIPAKALSECLEMLEQNRLIRFSDDNAELAHDSLAHLIDAQRTDEQRQLNEVKRRIQNSWLEYQKTGVFLNRRQLTAFEDHLPRLNLDLAVRQFIEDSYRNVEEAEEEERARQERELRLTQEKLAAEQKAARRQRLVFLAIIFAIVAAVATLFGIRANEQRNQTYREAYQRGILNAEVLRNNGQYTDAADQVSKTMEYARTRDQEDTLQLLGNLYRALGPLMAEGDALAERDETLAQALNSYRSAYDISPDSLIKAKLDRTTLLIQAKFENYLNMAENLKEFAGCRYALPVYRKAAQLQPQDTSVIWGKIKDCEQQ